MKPLKHPIRSGQTGDEVELLHSVLVYLGERVDEMERIVASYGPSTQDAVARVQRHLKLEVSGQIDELTAEALNAILKERRVLGQPSSKELQFLVRGQVVYREGLPIGDAVVRAFALELRKEVELGQARTDARGRFEIAYSKDRVPSKAAGGRPNVVVRAWDGQGAHLGESRVADRRFNPHFSIAFE